MPFIDPVYIVVILTINICLLWMKAWRRKSWLVVGVLLPRVYLLAVYVQLDVSGTILPSPHQQTLIRSGILLTFFASSVSQVVNLYIEQRLKNGWLSSHNSFPHATDK